MIEEREDGLTTWRVLIETTATGWVEMDAPTEADAMKWAAEWVRDGDLTPDWEWASARALEAREKE